jgi:succinoglycan biosynthesis transport protein ExoP
VFESYLQRELERDSVRHERQAVERTVAAVRAGTIEPQALWMLPAIRSVAPPELRTTIARLDSTETRLDRAVERYTNDHPIVQQLRAQITELRSSRIPAAVDGVIAELGRRERESDAQVSTLTERLRATPVHTTQEARLRRDLEAHASLYGTLRRRYDEATLAQTGVTPDISVLDPVVVPERPNSDKLPFVMILALMVSCGTAAGLALLRDRLDSRFRYPEQVVDELGLDLVGALPALDRGGLEDRGQASQVTEAFRTLRMTVTNALAGERPVTLAISSPGPGDGKSFVSANLALSFAAAGLQTVLMDADLRRGNLHARFGVEPSPGLVDWLEGRCTLDAVLRTTTDRNLTMVPRGSFDPDAHELLLGDRIQKLMAELRQRFAAVLVDSPPLGAGVDPLALGSAAGNLLFVLRAGQTDRHLAKAHVKVLSRLPIRVVGTVLNAVPDTGGYQYYGYMDSDLRGNRLPDAARQAADFVQRSGLSFQHYDDTV